MSAEASELVSGDHPDRIKWNAKYGAGFVPSFRPHPLAVRALALVLPDGPVADLACGPSGAALLAAEQGRRVTAVDVSEVALGLLGAEARRRGLEHLITLVHADLSGWAPEPRSYALVLATGFWDAATFAAAAAAVADGGLLGWAALTAEARRAHPDLPPEWCLAAGEPASLLPPGFTLIDQSDLPGRERRQMLARRRAPGYHVLLGKRRGVMDMSADEYPVWKKGADEYPAPLRVVGPGAVFVEHRLKSPQVAESAYIAPTAVLAGDVTVGPHSRVLFGAVITAEGGSVEIGANCVIMENAVIRGVPNQDMRVGDNVLVGPHTHLTGCVIEGDTRIATGAVVFNGARIETGAEVEFHAVVYVNTVVPSGMAVPMGWFAGGQPAELVPPDDWDRIRAIMGPLDYPGTVFGVGAREAPMPDVARRYARGLALHHNDHIIPDYGHAPSREG